MSVASKLRSGSLTLRDIVIVDAVAGAIGPRAFKELFGMSLRDYSNITDGRRFERHCNKPVQIEIYGGAIARARHADEAAIANAIHACAWIIYYVACKYPIIAMLIARHGAWTDTRDYAKIAASVMTDGQPDNVTLNTLMNQCVILVTPIVWSRWKMGTITQTDGSGTVSANLRALFKIFIPKAINDAAGDELLQAVMTSSMVYGTEQGQIGEVDVDLDKQSVNFAGPERENEWVKHFERVFPIS